MLWLISTLVTLVALMALSLSGAEYADRLTFGAPPELIPLLKVSSPPSNPISPDNRDNLDNIRRVRCLA